MSHLSFTVDDRSTVLNETIQCTSEPAPRTMEPHGEGSDTAVEHRRRFRLSRPSQDVSRIASRSASRRLARVDQIDVSPRCDSRSGSKTGSPPQAAPRAHPFGSPRRWFAHTRRAIPSSHGSGSPARSSYLRRQPRRSQIRRHRPLRPQRGGARSDRPQRAPHETWVQTLTDSTPISTMLSGNAYELQAADSPGRLRCICRLRTKPGGHPRRVGVRRAPKSAASSGVQARSTRQPSPKASETRSSSG